MKEYIKSIRRKYTSQIASECLAALRANNTIWHVLHNELHRRGKAGLWYAIYDRSKKSLTNRATTF